MPPRPPAPIERILAVLKQTDRPACTAGPLSASDDSLLSEAAALGLPWFLVAPGESPVARKARLRALDSLLNVPTIASLSAPVGRYPLILGHGPHVLRDARSVQALRDRLWIVAPFRSGLLLATAGIVADVLVLAERDARPVGAGLNAWRGASDEVRKALSASTLVVDAFAPTEIFPDFKAVCLFDSGLGGMPASARLPFHGYTILASVALVPSLGGSRVAVQGIGGGDGADRLRALLALFAHASDFAAINCGDPQSLPEWRTETLTRYVSSATGAKRTVNASPSECRYSLSVAAASLAECERRRFADLGARVRDGLEWLEAAKAGGADACQCLLPLIDEITDTWRQQPEARAILAGPAPPILGRLWSLASQRSYASRSPLRSSRAVATLILGELEEALRWCQEKLS